MATLGDVMLLASTILDDQANVRVTPMQMRMFINEGQREVARRSECLRAKATIATSANTASITLTQPIIRIAEAYWNGTGDTNRYPLVFRDHRANRSVWGSGRDVSRGTPNLFWTEGFPASTGFTLHLHPTPSVAGSLELHYYRHTTDFALNGADDDVVIDLPSGWHDVLTPWAVMRGMESQRQYEAAAQYRDEFDGRLTGLVDASTRYVDEPGSVMMDDWMLIFDADMDW